MKSRNKPSSNRHVFRYLIFPFGILFLLLLFSLGGRSLWDGQRRLTFAICTDPAFVFSMEPVTKNTAAFTIMTNTLLEVPFGYGAYPVQSIYKLGELDNKRGGGTILAKAIENTYGIWIDGYFAPKNFSFSSSEVTDQLSALTRRYFTFRGLFYSLIGKEKIKSNFSFLDRIRIILFIRNINPSNIQIIDFENSAALVEDRLPDGLAVKKVDKEYASLISASYFEDRQIRKENLSLEIVNASERNNLAAQFTQILTSLGVNVIFKSTSQTGSNFSCHIYLSDPSLDDSKIVDKLKKYYKCDVSTDQKETGTAQIKLVLGKDFYQ